MSHPLGIMRAMNSCTQLELSFAQTSEQPSERPQHIDFPLKSLPANFEHELKRVPTRWGRGQTLRSLRLHGIR
jgi:hypothetical protein